MIPLPTLDVLDSIAIPTPCTVPWDEMRGDDRTRFCAKCSQQVHDVSELTTAEAVRLLGADEKLPCLRIYRRADGRVMTADCPLTRRERVWKWLGRRSTWAASLFAVVFFGGCNDRPGMMAGMPCYVPSTHEKLADDQIEEHASRSVAAEDADRADPSDAVDTTDAHGQQESAAGR